MFPAKPRGLLVLQLLLLPAACREAGDAPAGRDGGTVDAAAAQDSLAAPVAPDAPVTCSGASASPCPPPGYATWPMPNPKGLPLPNPGGLTVGDGVAVDKVTGLMWQRTFAQKDTWVGAGQTCAALELAGYDDWRLPSRIEVISIVDHTQRPTVDLRAFDPTPADYFWSSSPVVSDGDLAFSVYFGAGLTTQGMKLGASALVRCVRGGRPGVLPRHSVDGDTVVDHNTGLTWQRGHAGLPLTWLVGATYCDDLTAGGHTNWRLPSANESQTLVDESHAGPAVDPQLFPGTPSARFWTGSSVDPSNLRGAVYLDMANATTEEAGTLEAMYVRCVR